ncbi:MAG: HAMP domain-containing protein [Acidobacteriia bacterium]|nr:HAMP domain-containing protein [Terriglobia bacterium]
MRTWSVGQRLTAWYAAVLLAGLALFGAGIWLLLENRLMAGVDESLAQEIAGLQTVFQIEGPESDAKQLRVELAEFTREIPDGSLIQLRDSSGALLLPLDSEPIFEKVAAGYGAVARKGRTLRLYTADIRYGGQTYTATVGASLDRVQSIVRDFRNLLFATAPGVLLIACLGGYWLSRRALRPVDEITHAARSISVTSLSKRLPVPRTGDEIQRLSEAWNDLLVRLEKAVGRIHQFTADASHELRTPVALIRSTAELMLRRERTPEEYRRALLDIEREADRMTDLTGSLLELAREDVGGHAIPLRSIDLNTVVQQVVELSAPLAEEKGVELRASLVAKPAVARANDAGIRRLLLILIDNALKHTPAAGKVNVSTAVSDRAIVLAVEDSGSGIDPDALPHIFERFYRASESRNGGGAGLGLSIAQTIARAHGSSVEVHSSPGAGSRFEITLPG